MYIGSDSDNVMCLSQDQHGMLHDAPIHLGSVLLPRCGRRRLAARLQARGSCRQADDAELAEDEAAIADALLPVDSGDSRHW